MSIVYHAETKTFYLDTAASTYAFQISQQGHLLHLHYGEKIAHDDFSYICMNFSIIFC